MNPLLQSLGILCKRLTNRYATVSAMLLVLLLPEFTFATHISGADLTYRWVSGNTYELTLALYPDCSGISAPTNLTITYSSVTCGVNSTVTINKKPGTGNEISMVCSTAVTTCSGGTYPGFQKWEYVGNVTLPNQCPDWVFGYSICCRNCAITTLSYTPNNCTGVPATYIEATLNNVAVPNNSAPSFTNIPVLFFVSDKLYTSITAHTIVMETHWCIRGSHPDRQQERMLSLSQVTQHLHRCLLLLQLHSIIQVI